MSDVSNASRDESEYREAIRQIIAEDSDILDELE